MDQNSYLWYFVGEKLRFSLLFGFRVGINKSLCGKGLLDSSMKIFYHTWSYNEKQRIDTCVQWRNCLTVLYSVKSVQMRSMLLRDIEVRIFHFNSDVAPAPLLYSKMYDGGILIFKKISFVIWRGSINLVGVICCIF